MRGAGVGGTGLPGVYFADDISTKEKNSLLKKVKEVAYVPGRRGSLVSDVSSDSSFILATPISKYI